MASLPELHRILGRYYEFKDENVHSGVDLLTFTAKLFPVNLCTQRLHTEYEPIPMS